MIPFDLLKNNGDGTFSFYTKQETLRANEKERMCLGKQSSKAIVPNILFVLSMLLALLLIYVTIA
jgi:hypothetical protein